MKNYTDIANYTHTANDSPLGISVTIYTCSLGRDLAFWIYLFFSSDFRDLQQLRQYWDSHWHFQ